jgi:hypothetical protein
MEKRIRSVPSHVRAGARLQLACGLSLLLALLGCDGGEAPPTGGGSDEPTSRPSVAVPDLPDAPHGAPGASDVLIDDLTTRRAFEQPEYVQDQAVKTGSLSGFCHMPGRVRIPVPQRVDPTAEPHKIPAPQPGEAAHYTGAALKLPVRIGDKNPAKRVGVSGAVILLRGIKEGPLPPPEQAVISVGEGILRGYYGQHTPPYYGVQIAPVATKLLLRNFDPYPSQLVLTDLTSGKMLCERSLPADTVRFRGHAWSRKVKTLQSAPILRAGPYVVTCKRHPWQKTHVFAVTHPYVTVSQGRYNRSGLFNLDKVPVGRWKMHVWHPTYEPVQPTREVEIKTSETLEIAVEFKVPPQLKE